MTLGTEAESGERILVVDDSEPNLLLLHSLLTMDGFQVDTAASGPDALAQLEQVVPDLILLDVMMPEMSGFEVCQRLRSEPRTADVPVIFLTALSEVPERVKGLEVGGNDYIPKPFHPDELRARIKAALRQKQAQDRLRRERESLASQAVTDPLTGIYNRRMLDTRLHEEVARCRRYGDPLTCLMVDLDFFKQVNDGHGHQTGDMVLQQFVEVAHSCLRSSDILARYGGEEFVILVTQTDLTGAVVTAEKVRRQVEAKAFATANGQTLRLTVSIGVAELEPDDTPESLVGRADVAVYRAKRTGRNQVVCA